jgi:hypothetical protein
MNRSVGLLVSRFSAGSQRHTLDRMLLGAHGCVIQAPPPPPTEILKNTDFAAIMISKVLRDLPFSRNQPLMSADG